MQALRERRDGQVVLEVRLAADGGVGEAWVIASSGIAILDRAALRAVLRWRYPADARRRQFTVPLRFHIDAPHAAALR